MVLHNNHNWQTEVITFVLNLQLCQVSVFAVYIFLVLCYESTFMDPAKSALLARTKSNPFYRKMSLRRLRPDHYKQLAAMLVPIGGILFGAYQQFLHDHDHALFRNKSKMFGGKQLPEGKEAWY
ncbi:hypothetical protein RRG08_007339 [Elysia crispata]|uniref:Complex I-MNLL n=1 Tax=Elysia crispata TaxID=231223 RepID=A0AAE1AR03_9GAST|nr:hypothetical protein RRG08_007339 [Elysia crispata]